MRRILAVLTALAIVTTGLTAVPGLASYNQEQGGQPDDAQSRQDGQQDRQNKSREGGADQRPDQPMNAQDRRQWAQEKRQQALDRARQAGLFGQLTYEDGQVNGTFIEATVASGTGNVSQHTLVSNDTSLTVLERFAPEEDAFGSNLAADPVDEHNATVLPSTLVLPFEDGELRLQDNPTGQIHYRSTAPANVTIEAADGYDVTVDENATKARIKGDVNASIVLTGEGNLTADGGTLEASLDEAGGVLFQAEPDSPGERVSQRALEHAAEQDKLGGEIRVAGAAGEPVNQATPVDVNMSAQYADHGQAIVEVDGDVEEGRVVNLKISKANLDVNETQEVVPKLDREAIPVEDSIDEIVNATSDEAVAHVAVRERVVEVTVWVPEFSIHSVNVQDSTADVSDIPDPVASTNPTGAAVSLATQTRQRALSQAQAWDELGPQTQTEATANAQQAGLFGQANLEAGTLQGAHVQASVDTNAGTIEDYRLVDRASPATVFEQIRLTDFTQAEAVQELGPAIALPGEQVAILAHDTPSGHLEIEAGDAATQVELDVPSDVEVDRVNEDRLRLTTPTGLEVHLAVVAGEADLIVEGDTIVASLGANAAVHAIAEPGSQVPAKANIEDRVKAATEGDLGAEASITAVNETPVEDRVETSVQLDTQNVDQSEGSVTVRASSQTPEPRAVALNLDPQLVDEIPAEEVAVLVDGQAVEAAADAEAVLEAGSTASFHAEQAGEGLQVLVNLEGFSDHDVTVQSSDDTETTDGTDDTDGTNDTTDGTDGGDGQTEDAPFPAVGLLLATIGTVAALARRRG